MSKVIPLRREFLEKCIVRGLLTGAAMSQAQLFGFWQKAEEQSLKPSPVEVLGPFYKKGAPNQANMRVAGEPGFPLKITGKIVNTRGEAIPGARIDVWHADFKGIYDVHGYRYRSKLAIDSVTEYAIDTPTINMNDGWIISQ